MRCIGSLVLENPLLLEEQFSFTRMKDFSFIHYLKIPFGVFG